MMHPLFRDWERPRSSTHQLRQSMGLTLVECLVAMLILSIAVFGMSYATTAGHQHLLLSDKRLRAIRLAEHLLEEIQSRPYAGSGAVRSSFCVDDYNGFLENPGELKHYSGSLYDSEDQIFSRSASVGVASQTVADLEGAIIPGKTVVVTLQDSSGCQWQLSRFIPQPISP